MLTAPPRHLSGVHTAHEQVHQARFNTCDVPTVGVTARRSDGWRCSTSTRGLDGFALHRRWESPPTALVLLRGHRSRGLRGPRPSPSLSPPPRLSPSPVPSRSLASSPPLSHHHPPYRAGLRVAPFMYLSSAELEKLRSEASRPSSSSPELLPHSPESLPLPPPVLSSPPHSVSSPARSLLVLRQGPSDQCVQHPTHSSVEDTTAAHLLSMAALPATTASVAAPAPVPSEDTHCEGGAAQCEATSRLDHVCYVRALSTVLTLTPSSRAPHARLHPLLTLVLASPSPVLRRRGTPMLTPP